MTDQTEDVIDLLAGLENGSPLATLRQRRPATRDNAQASFDALFRPEFDSPGFDSTVTASERWAVAAFVTALHADDETADFYAAGLAEVAAPDVAAANNARRI